jgi:hypothetical protein
MGFQMLILGIGWNRGDLPIPKPQLAWIIPAKKCLQIGYSLFRGILGNPAQILIAKISS